MEQLDCGYGLKESASGGGGESSRTESEMEIDLIERKTCKPQQQTFCRP
jgi:hypothetical protein